MASEVTKYSVYDPRVIQTKPKYAVEKGALSITNVSFNAQTANQSSQQFNVIVPSENVFIDRAVDWVSGGVASILVTYSASGTAGDSGNAIFGPGELATAAFPSHQCVAQMTATINDATVTVNTQDVLNQVLRLQDLAAHRKQRTCPTMLDLYGYAPPATNINAAFAGLYENSPMNGYGARFESDQAPNGAWAQWYFCDSSGVPLTTNGGLPVSTTGATDTVYVRWQSTEKLLLPPFIFGDAFELSTGLFGVQNFQVQMNMLPNPSRAIRVSAGVIGKAVGARIISSIGLPQWVTSGLTGSTFAPYPFQPALSVQFMTPALDVPLPPKSIVPYMEFPRYITTGLSSVPSTLGVAPNAKGITTGSVVLASNTITLPNIPDLLMIYVKPPTAGATIFGTGTGTAGAPYAFGTSTTAGGSTWDSTISDFTLPIEGISINFDNFSGLLANHTQYQLYKMSINNGLDMDFNSWSGEGRQASTTGTGTGTNSGIYTSLVGGPLVLRPGRDFALQAGQAPGLVGNFTLQFQLTVGNQFKTPIQGLNLYVVPISSGFFETIKGSSRIIKGVLTEQDILSSPAHAPEPDLERMVGAGRRKHQKGPMNDYM